MRTEEGEKSIPLAYISKSLSLAAICTRSNSLTWQSRGHGERNKFCTWEEEGGIGVGERCVRERKTAARPIL